MAYLGHDEWINTIYIFIQYILWSPPLQLKSCLFGLSNVKPSWWLRLFNLSQVWLISVVLVFRWNMPGIKFRKEHMIGSLILAFLLVFALFGSNYRGKRKVQVLQNRARLPGEIYNHKVCCTVWNRVYFNGTFTTTEPSYIYIWHHITQNYSITSYNITLYCIVSYCYHTERDKRNLEIIT